MKKHSLNVIVILLVSAALIYSCSKDQFVTSSSPSEDTVQLISQQPMGAVPSQYIVVYKDGEMPISSRAISANDYEASKQIVKEESVRILASHRISAEPIHTYAKTIQGFAVQLSEEELVRLRSDNRVAYIEQNQMGGIAMGGPPGSGGDPQSTPWGITRIGGAGDGTGQTAWIIDSGIDFDHPDLNVDVARSASFGSGGGGANDANGHGTHVAGTVAAIDNNIGVIGVAAGASVVAVRVVNRRGSGTTAECIAGVDYVGANGAAGDAANMSLRYGFSTALNSAVSNAAGSGIKFAIAAGNDSQDTNNVSPGSVNGSNIYTVSAMSQGDNWASFSNFSNPPVDYCAPGVSVYSCYKNGGYATLSGTSMASPHVCGILLLGNVSSSGTVSGDPDGTPDPIAHR